MSAALSPAVIATFQEAAEVLKPPPKFTVSSWAERCRMLSTEASSEAGRYRVSRAPYQRGMMDAVNLPGVTKVTYFTGAQLGKSTCFENIFAYFCAEDPCSIIYMWPTDLVAKAWSVDTLEPMIRDTPSLEHLFLKGSRKSANSTLFKKFPGGHLSLIGANSASGLRRRRARVVFCEEIDGYPPSAGEEGDPRSLVRKRQETFWNAVMLEASTCTIKGMSAIEASYEDSNQQKFFVPCPHCSEVDGKLEGFQVLRWKRMEIDHVYPHTGTEYMCEHCGALIAETYKDWMLANGEWRAEHPERAEHQGFWLSTLYSPFKTWAGMAADFLNAVAHRENPELLKAFVTLSLAETWADEETKIDEEELMKRREDYLSSALPDGVTVLTAGVDVQEDRFELVVKGWGKGQESWCVDWVRIDGDTAKEETWAKLDAFLLNARYTHARGVKLDIASAFIDTGFRAAEVFKFTKTRWDRRVHACRGFAGFNRAPVGKWNRSNQAKQKVYPVHVDVVKELVYSRLRLTDKGAGYMHFSTAKNDLEYFKQLKSEKLRRKYVKGFPVRFWEKPAGARNEALDCEVYATAALLALAEDPAKMLAFLREKLLAEAKRIAEERKLRVDPNQLDLLSEGAVASDSALALGSRDAALAPRSPESTEEPAVVAPEPEKQQETTPRVIIRRSWV